MKRKLNFFPLILIFVTIFGLLSLPKLVKGKLTGTTISLLTPIWEKVFVFKNLFYCSESSTHISLPGKNNERIQQLELQNQSLQNEMITYKELLEHELNLITQLSSYIGQDFQELKEDIKQHKKEIHNLLKMQFKSIPAHVIFRSNSSWNSSLWIDVGSENNSHLSENIIQKNSPVVVGKSLIGVIDYVGKHQSRVRLITDSGLCPSVRVCRGAIYSRFLKESIQSLAGILATKPELFKDNDEKATFLKGLESLRNNLATDPKTWLLAKGELQGTSYPLWRSPGHTLKGIGFNYDFADEEGPARDLRSGKPLNAPQTIPTIPIIDENDLLVTTGLDGIFPPGLPVAEVTKIHFLKEGDYFYEIEAKPTAVNLEDLFLVYILPPISFSITDQPSIRGVN